jgi:hypothetical protein
MAAAGLIELPEQRTPESPEFIRLPHPRGVAVPIAREAVPVPVISGPEPVARHPPPGGDPPVGENNAGQNRLPRLARRKPGAKLPKEFAGESPPVHQGTDEVLLKRIRTALRALR